MIEEVSAHYSVAQATDSEVWDIVYERVFWLHNAFKCRKISPAVDGPLPPRSKKNGARHQFLDWLSGKIPAGTPGTQKVYEAVRGVADLRHLSQRNCPGVKEAAGEKEGRFTNLPMFNPGFVHQGRLLTIIPPKNRQLKKFKEQKDKFNDLAYCFLVLRFVRFAEQLMQIELDGWKCPVTGIDVCIADRIGAGERTDPDASAPENRLEVDHLLPVKVTDHQQSPMMLVSQKANRAHAHVAWPDWKKVIDAGPSAFLATEVEVECLHTSLAIKSR